MLKHHNAGPSGTTPLLYYGFIQGSLALYKGSVLGTAADLLKEILHVHVDDVFSLLLDDASPEKIS